MLRAYMKTPHTHTPLLQLGGSFSSEPEDMVDSESNSCSLSPSTQDILRRCFEDLVSGREGERERGTQLHTLAFAPSPPGPL